ncbi:MAG: ribosome recycling factor [Candidatus Dojkabacteria bacterium]|nr:MAG: ribosome recycling factor [Candidatus Dojkabacteria bacterium]
MDEAKLTADMGKCVDHLRDDLAQLRTGRATVELLEPVKVMAYGAENPIKSIANVAVADSKTLVVQPWDKSIVAEIAKGISAANLGFSVVEEGDFVRVSLPDLTEERRKDLVKVMKERVEASRVAVRSVRHEYMEAIEDAVKNGMSEDEGKRQKESVEKAAKKCNDEIEQVREQKEASLMEV